MDFFRSLLSEPTPPSSPTTQENPDFTPPTSPPPTQPSSSASSTSFFTSIASKSDSFLQNYYKDLQEFTTAFKQETSLISRAVQDLPSRLDSGAAIAQNSLEALGQAVDNLGSTLINTGKDFNFTPNYGMFLASVHKDRDDAGSDAEYSNYAPNYGKDPNAGDVGSSSERPYSRLEAMIRGLQCSLSTYCDDVEDHKSEFDEWIKGFRVEDKSEEIERLIAENHVMKDIYDEIVPGKVDNETFWLRYFYKAGKVIEAEEARTRLLNRAISGEDDEELSWDVEDDDDDRDGKPRNESENETKEIGATVENLKVEGSPSGSIVDAERSLNNEREGSDGKLGSDVSIISSHRSSSHNEDDLGWDEIEDIISGDEHKVTKAKDHTVSDDAVDVKKRSTFTAEEDEDLSWDIEDDDEPVRS